MPMTSSEILAKGNIKPSLIRVMIFDYLREHRTHPTVDDIYSDLHPKIPTLSKTTVYNTVKLLADAGIIKTVTIEDSRLRYDACTDTHGHFLCTLCGKVYDFDTGEFAVDGLDGFDVQTKDVYCTGVCKNCVFKK